MSAATRMVGAVGVGAVSGLIALGAGVAPAAEAANTTETLVAATTTVNIRSSASTTATILGGLERGQRITALGTLSGTWVKVRLAGSTAYIVSEYLNTTGEDLPPAPTAIDTAGTKTATADLNVRSGAAVTRKKVGLLREGSTFTLTGKLSGGYAQTVYAGHRRWVTQQYLATLRDTTVTPPVVPPVTAPVVGNQGVQALEFAKAQLGKPYKWGAVGPKAYDCSGLVLAAWKSVGVTLPRTSQQQFRNGGARIAKADLQSGDLVFFYGSKPSHVAIYAGDGQVIHAPRPGKHVEYIPMSYMPYSGAVRPGS